MLVLGRKNSKNNIFYSDNRKSTFSGKRNFSSGNKRPYNGEKKDINLLLSIFFDHNALREISYSSIKLPQNPWEGFPKPTIGWGSQKLEPDKWNQKLEQYKWNKWYK